jgi:hypothetical protein
LIELMVSPPAFAGPTTFAFEACACTRCYQESVFMERRALPNMAQTGQYASIMHYQRAVEAAGHR